MREFYTSAQANARLDRMVCRTFEKSLQEAAKEMIQLGEGYSVEDLNQRINEEQTLAEFIRDSEETFGLEKRDLSGLSPAELNSYILKLDLIWGYCFAEGF